MMNADKLADIFAGGSYEINGVHRLVIQPKSVLREFKTIKYGFLFVVRGEATISVNEKEYKLRRGSVLHAAPGMRMDARATGLTEYEYYTVYYSFGDASGGRECDVHFLLDPAASPRVAELLAVLHQNARTKDGIGRLRAKQLFLSVLDQVLTGCKHREAVSAPGRRAIEAAVDYINGHYMDPLTLDELAELHAMSPKSFSYFFHKHTGLRPIDYVIHYRMERARELLGEGNYLVRDVAVSVGYANPLYFSRAFKKKFGVSPTDYALQTSNRRPE
ncbi:helix-turn-helix domain-containing protein [Cohnella sp. LGH]|uniref:helix-turn-helix domain-containing protein n=1 Tax=Cohnella sp. LGH TaxID=1619153 RepID=UPI001ADBEC37|nr:AraC family transcriptional regulator [Cohnella sp. LGH]QTH40162.1 helix-turn-helix domain-containing protein [Cohnella sp. LGH]